MMMWLFLFFKEMLTFFHNSNLTPEMRSFHTSPSSPPVRDKAPRERWEPKGLTCLVVFDSCRGWLLAAVLEVAEK